MKLRRRGSRYVLKVEPFELCLIRWGIQDERAKYADKSPSWAEVCDGMETVLARRLDGTA